MPLQDLQRPRSHDTVAPPDRTPPPTPVVESVSGGRLLALLVAVVGLSVLTSLVVGRPDPAAEPVEDASPASAAEDSATAGAATPADAGTDVVGSFVPRSELAAAPADEVNVATAPEMPPPITRTVPAVVDVAFEIVEQVSTIDPATGAQYETWGYRVTDGADGVVVGTPGPVIRARVGDVLRFALTNPAGNTHPHNVDLHAVTGQGGGAADTTVAPGETATIEARMLYPGFFMYHCAYGDVPSHISHGMFGGILVEPAVPLPTVDHEWYLVQSEYYTTVADGATLAEDRAALSAEEPSHVVFNGAVGSLVDDGALRMGVGERARIHFVNAGLNLDSNFHPIGSHWDVVYQEAALLNVPLRGSQTTLVPAGGGTVVELVGQVPQTIVLVDHALARAFDKGAIGQVVVEGETDPEIFDAVPGDAPDVTDDASGATADTGTATSGPTPTTDATAGASGEAEATATTAVTIEPGAGVFREFDQDDWSDAALAGYGPSVLEVAVGDTVTWTNDDTMAHTVTSPDGAFDSGMVQPGESWSHTFTEAGEFPYLCTPHPWMRGRVDVN
ncbi:plastocyanin/azurin family copper-binding protein [Salsipaludibacter albus]|uniref:plastocyanin/azurin family copper-binding protein n=1 Tax=Salsipaludibacter albus TaxID=2849650 RepID=UPI001EE3A97E|nr:plastocyanin/azurin family copper-binding protein [Salsipaludibacter albus]MBY5163939.1 multicopper oxidase domain-containing protein [Salsipaludibacter albus]